MLEARAATAEIAVAAGPPHRRVLGRDHHRRRARPPARAGDVASLTLLVCALDNARAGTASALAGREVAAAAVAESARKGYLDGRALAGVFAWLRPNDLIWGYVVNNYLMGRRPPAFDVLYWNQDTVRLAAGLHRDFVRIALENSLTRAGAVEVLGEPVDLGAVTADAYAVAGLNDHLVPWENAYRSALLLGGETRFVLSTSGHIQALVNPPHGREPRELPHGRRDPDRPEEWLARRRPGAGGRTGRRGWPSGRASARPAPAKLGSRAHRARGKAPGSYVHAA